MGSTRAALSVVVVLAVGGWSAAGAATPGADWAVQIETIEACSCPMFCQCYFNSKPAAHGGHGGHGGHEHGEAGAEHFCKFNNAYQVKKGHYGETSLDGARFWVAGDLGGDFSEGKMDWATLYFDRKLSPAQRDAIGTIVGQMFPVQWSSLTTAEADIDTWQYDDKGAVATMDGGKTAEVRLRAFPGLGGKQVVIENLPYWGVPRNSGFVMMPNEIEAYRAGDKPFEYKGTNGFMITLEMTSADVAPAAGMGGAGE